MENLQSELYKTVPPTSLSYYLREQESKAAKETKHMERKKPSGLLMEKTNQFKLCSLNLFIRLMFLFILIIVLVLVFYLIQPFKILEFDISNIN